AFSPPCDPHGTGRRAEVSIPTSVGRNEAAKSRQQATHPGLTEPTSRAKLRVARPDLCDCDGADRMIEFACLENRTHRGAFVIWSRLSEWEISLFIPPTAWRKSSASKRARFLRTSKRSTSSKSSRTA